MERDLLLQVVFDWRVWSVMVRAECFAFLAAFIHQAARKVLDSRICLVQNSLKWLTVAMEINSDVEHLAAQLVSALKPFAGNRAAHTFVVNEWRRRFGTSYFCLFIPIHVFKSSYQNADMQLRKQITVGSAVLIKTTLVLTNN